MSVYQYGSVECVAWFSLHPNTQKVLRGLLFAVMMGVVSIYAMENGAQPTPVTVAYILGGLLVYGVDIAKIKAGPVEIWFEVSESEHGQAEIDTDWHKE